MKLSKYIINVAAENKGYILYLAISLITINVLAISLPNTSKNIFDLGLFQNNLTAVCKYCTIFLCISIVKSLVEVGLKNQTLLVCKRLKDQLFSKYLHHLLRIDTSFFLNRSGASILSEMNTDINCLINFIESKLVSVLTQVCIFAGGIVGLFLINPYMAIIVLLFIPLKLCLMFYFSKKNKGISEEIIYNSSKYANWFDDCIKGIKEIKVYLLHQKTFCTHKRLKEKIMQSEYMLGVLHCINAHIDYILISFLTILIYILSAFFYIRGEISFGEITAFSSYISFVMNPLTSFFNIRYYYSSIQPSLERLSNFFEYVTEKTGREKIANISSIEFKDVKFSFDMMQPSILNGLCLKINPCEKIAIIGANGTGKSTIVNLLLRLLPIQEGQILVNNCEIEKYDIDDYRSHFGVVFQNAHLFSCPLTDNITLVATDIENTHSIDKNASFIEWCQKQSGASLSGGEKQKVAIGRAIYANRAVLIMDEPESSLDIDTQKDICNLIQSCNDKIIIMITHSNKYHYLFDRVLTLNDGIISDN